MVTTISAQNLFEHACHYGQKTSRWNPKMKQFFHGSKKGVHIFDLNQTAEFLAILLNRIEEIVKAKKTILFVSTKPHTQDILQQIKDEADMPIVSYKWVGGLLTNFSNIKENILTMKKLREEFATGAIKRYTKKEQSTIMKKLEKLENLFGGLVNMHRLPDALFVVDGFKDKTALEEAKQLGIEILGIADSNANPDDYNYFVPANDDSRKSLELMLGHILTTILTNKK